MAFRYDKPYRTNINIDSQKIYDLFNLVYQMDTQEIIQYSLINKVPLYVTLPTTGNNLIHEILLNDDKLKNEFNKLNIIKFLVKNDVNPDEPNKENQTPIHIACQKQHQEIVEYLVNECEVNLNYKDNNGFSALHYLLIGDIKLFEKKEISDLISFQRKDNIIKKDDILEIKKLLYPILKEEPFVISLEKTIYETLKNSPEIENILLETQNKIQKNISSTEKINIIKENTEFINIQRNEIKKIVEKSWNKFNNSTRIELHVPTDDSYKIEENIGLIKNANIKKEIKKKLLDNVDKFKNYSNNIIDLNNNTVDELNKDKLLVEPIYTEFLNTCSPDNITISKNKDIFYNKNIDFLTDDYKLFDNVNNNFKSKLANDYADNIINMDDNTFYGGSRNMILDKNYSIYDFNTIKDWFIDEKNDEIKFTKLFIFLILNTNYIEIDNLKTFDDIDNYINTLLLIDNNDIIYNYLNNYINKLFNPDYATEIYCKYIEICTLMESDPFSYNLNSNYNILIINIIACLIHQQYTFDHFISYLSFFLVPTLYKIKKNQSLVLKLIFGHFVKPLHNFDINNINNYLPNNVIEIFDLIDAYYTTTTINNNIIEEIIKKANIMVENNEIKVPNIMLTDFIYMIKNYSYYELFYSYYIKDNLTYNKFINLLNTKFKKYGINDLKFDYESNDIFNLLLSYCGPSFQNFIYCLLYNEFNDNYNNNFYFNKFFEAINLKLKFKGVIPILLENVDESNMYNIDLNKNNLYLLDFNAVLPNLTLPLPGNYYFSNNDIKKTDTYGYYIYNKYQYRPPFNLSLCNLYIYQINRITMLLRELFINPDNSYYILLNSIKQGKIKNISKYYLEFYYIINNLVTLQKELVNNYKKYSNKDLNVKIFDITELNNFLNKINANIFLYYYLFSKDKTIKIPQFSYYRVDHIKSFIFDSRYDVLLPNYEPTNIQSHLFDITKNKFKPEKIKSDYFTSYLSNIFLDNGIIRIQQYYQNNKVELPPSMEIELGTFFEYNKILLLQNLDKNKYNKILDKIKDIVVSIKDTKINLSQEVFYLFKLIEENIKDQTDLFVDKAISKLLYENNISEISENKQLYSIGEFKNTKISFDDKVDDDTFRNFYLFRNKDKLEDCKFIIYPNEYNNTNILKQLYCLKINQNILTFLIEKNADPYAIDDNSNSVISPLEKTYHHQSIETLRKNDIDINNFGLPKNPFDQLKYECINHISKLTNGSNYNEFITNFVSSQYNEIKVILRSNDRFGNNIINYLDTSFKTIFYIINEYLTDVLWRFNDDYKLDDMTDIFNLTNNNKINITNNYLFNYINLIKIPSSDNIIIMKDYLRQLNEELNILQSKIIKLDSEVYELRKGGLTKQIFDLTNKRKTLIIDFNTKNKIYNIINTKINNDPYLPPINTNKNPKQIIKTYDDFVINNSGGVYLECWEELFKSDLTKTWNLDLIKITIQEKVLFKNINLNVNDYKSINKFYKQLSDLSKIYFEESKYTERNKVLKFVYELLEHITKTYICFNIEMTLRNLLTKYFMDLSIDNNFIEINKKINYLLDAKNIINDKKFTDILYNDLPKEFVRNSVDIFYNYTDKQSFEPKSIKEILNDLFNLLSVSDIINIPSNSPFMQILNNDLTDYFDLFIQRLINNWLVVIENIFKFTINQYRINKCILELIQ